MELFELIAGFRFQHLQLQQRHRTEIHVRTANLLDLPRRELDVCYPTLFPGSYMLVLLTFI